MTPLLYILGVVAAILVVNFFVLNWATFVAFGDVVAPRRPKSRVPQKIGFVIFCISLLSFFILLMLEIAAGIAAVSSAFAH